jgi:hypothetical protein
MSLIACDTSSEPFHFLSWPVKRAVCFAVGFPHFNPSPFIESLPVAKHKPADRCTHPTFSAAVGISASTGKITGPLPRNRVAPRCENDHLLISVVRSWCWIVFSASPNRNLFLTRCIDVAIGWCHLTLDVNPYPQAAGNVAQQTWNRRPEMELLPGVERGRYVSKRSK